MAPDATKQNMLFGMESYSEEYADNQHGRIRYYPRSSGRSSLSPTHMQHYRQHRNLQLPLYQYSPVNRQSPHNHQGNFSSGAQCNAQQHFSRMNSTHAVHQTNSFKPYGNANRNTKWSSPGFSSKRRTMSESFALPPQSNIAIPTNINGAFAGGYEKVIFSTPKKAPAMISSTPNKTPTFFTTPVKAPAIIASMSKKAPLALTCVELEALEASKVSTTKTPLTCAELEAIQTADIRCSPSPSLSTITKCSSSPSSVIESLPSQAQSTVFRRSPSPAASSTSGYESCIALETQSEISSICPSLAEDSAINDILTDSQNVSSFLEITSNETSGKVTPCNAGIDVIASFMEKLEFDSVYLPKINHEQVSLGISGKVNDTPTVVKHIQASSSSIKKQKTNQNKNKRVMKDSCKAKVSLVKMPAKVTAMPDVSNSAPASIDLPPPPCSWLRDYVSVPGNVIYNEKLNVTQHIKMLAGMGVTMEKSIPISVC